jgi:hypothetical protein
MGGQLNRAGLLNLLSATFKPGIGLGTTVLRVARCHRACVIVYVAVLWSGLTVCKTAPVSAADVPLINVYVTCDGADSVGASLCFVVKEAIISSGRYQLVDDNDDKIEVGLHLVSVDTSPLTTVPKCSRSGEKRSRTSHPAFHPRLLRGQRN